MPSEFSPYPIPGGILVQVSFSPSPPASNTRGGPHSRRCGPFQVSDGTEHSVLVLFLPIFFFGRTFHKNCSCMWSFFPPIVLLCGLWKDPPFWFAGPHTGRLFRSTVTFFLTHRLSGPAPCPPLESFCPSDSSPAFPQKPTFRLVSFQYPPHSLSYRF